jgi:uncharacterized protein (DUF58 family)
MFDSKMGRAFLIVTLGGVFAVSSVFANSPTVTAVLRNSEAAVGETVELQIKVNGAGSGKPP